MCFCSVRGSHFSQILQNQKLKFYMCLFTVWGSHYFTKFLLHICQRFHQLHPHLGWHLNSHHKPAPPHSPTHPTQNFPSFPCLPFQFAYNIRVKYYVLQAHESPCRPLQCRQSQPSIHPSIHIFHLFYSTDDEVALQVQNTITTRHLVEQIYLAIQTAVVKNQQTRGEGRK